MDRTVAIKSNILRFSLDTQDRAGDPRVEMQVFYFSQSKRTFQMTTKKVLPLGFTGSELELVKVKCLFNKFTGLLQPCLLLRQLQIKPSSKDQTCIYHVLLLEGFDSLLSVGSFEAVGAKTRDLHLQLFDGPSVSWVAGESVYFAHYDSTVGNFMLDSIIINNSMNDESEKNFTLLWCGVVDNEMIAMGAKSEMIDGSSLLVRWTCVNHSQRTVEEIPLVPDVYTVIGTCCLIREPFRTGTVTQGCLNPVFDRLEVYLATNRGQLLKFAGGRLKNCWQLPFDDPCEIWMLEPELDEAIVIVQSRTKMVCAVNCKKRQVVKDWDGIDTILIDDFLESGKDQVLFLPRDFTITETGEFSKFTLVDISRGMISIESSQETSLLQSHQPQSDALQRTARALRTQLQAGAATLNEAKLECNEKLKMVEHSCKVLKGITSSSSSSPNSEEMQEKSPGLFCLLEGALDDAEQHKPVEVMTSTLTVKEIWQRIIDDQWIIGIDVENSCESPVSDLVLGLVSCQPEPVEYSSKPVFCGDNIRLCEETEASTKSECIDTSSYDKSPSFKRKKMSHCEVADSLQFLLPGNQTRLTVVSSLPTFKHKDNYSTSVVLTWSSRCKDSRHHAMHCGCITLQTEQIINGSLRLNRRQDKKSIQQDIVAFKSISIETELLLQSSKSCLHQLIPFLQRTMGVPVLQTVEASVSGDTAVQLISRTHCSGPLAGTGIVLHSGFEEGRFKLVTRNKNQVYLLLHKLRQTLPEDVTILPDTTSDQYAVQSSLSSLNHEVTALQQNLHRLMQQTSAGAHRGVSGTEKSVQGKEQKQDSIGTLREGYERKRQREGLGKEELVNKQKDLAKLWNNLVQDQMATDHTVAKILNC